MSPRSRPLRALRLGLALLAMAVCGVARAQPQDVVAAWEEEVSRLAAERAPLAQKREELEARSRAAGAEIERLKAQPPGIGRDLRLGEALAAAQQRADELSRLSSELRPRDKALSEARAQLLAACRATIADPRALADRRAAAARLLPSVERQLAESAAAPALRVAPAGAVDPLEGPVELGERADRLHDDADKLQREAARLARRIEGLEERARLRERAAEMGDDLFVEGSVGRRAPRPTANSQARENTLADKATRDSAAPTANGSLNGPPNPLGSEGGSSSSATLRGVVDPSTLAELRRAEAGSDPERALQALRRARGEIADKAAELSRREAELRRRAAELRRSK